MKRVLIIAGIIVAFAALYAFNKLTTKTDDTNIFAEAKQDLFEISISSSGELLAEHSVDILGPELGASQQNQGRSGNQRGMDMRMVDIKITDIVPEGTVVKEGEYIAQLDRTSYSNSLKDAMDNLTTETNSLGMKVLDTAVALTNLRDDIKNQRYTVEEARITLAQSKFEPPATIRQAEINLDKAERSLEQKKKSYQLRVAQNLADIKRQQIRVNRAQSLVTDLQEYLAQFTITAPSPGMIIYKKDRMGNKRKTGSSINLFDKTIATLPDLSSMLSKIYVNEIEVSKVKPGQEVLVTIDAIPGKAFKGKVFTIANIGEVLPNSDAKMFEVIIKLDESDPELRPSMTTTNKILINSFQDVISIPAECVMAGVDSVPFVYTKNHVKQIVVLGDANEKNVIIKKGLEPGTLVYATMPAEVEKFRLRGEELIAEIKKK